LVEITPWCYFVGDQQRNWGVHVHHFKLKKVQGDEQKGIQFFVPQTSMAKKSPPQKKTRSQSREIN
jgi:hypothetical protein